MSFGGNVTGKGQIGLCVPSVSLTLTFAFRCFCYIITHNGLPRGTLPLCLNIKPKCLWTSGPCPPVDGCRKEEINTSPPGGWPLQGTFANHMAFLLYVLISSPSLCYKRNWHLNPGKMIFQRHESILFSVCRLSG